MFRLPFAAGRVFSISMLDTLLYQVGPMSSTSEDIAEIPGGRHGRLTGVQSWSTSAPLCSVIDMKNCSLSSTLNSQFNVFVSLGLWTWSVFCERLHDRYSQTAAGPGHHPRVWIPLCCKLDMISISDHTHTNYFIHPSLFLFSVSDESHRGGPVDRHIRQTVPETLLLQCWDPHRDLPDRVPHFLNFWG